MKQKEVSEYLGITMDSLRNWEMNGLLTVKRRENGYRKPMGTELLAPIGICSPSEKTYRFYFTVLYNYRQ